MFFESNVDRPEMCWSIYTELDGLGLLLGLSMLLFGAPAYQWIRLFSTGSMCTTCVMRFSSFRKMMVPRPARYRPGYNRYTLLHVGGFVSMRLAPARSPPGALDLSQLPLCAPTAPGVLQAHTTKYSKEVCLFSPLYVRHFSIIKNRVLVRGLPYCRRLLCCWVSVCH